MTMQPSSSASSPPSPQNGTNARRNLFVDLSTATVFTAMIGTGILLQWVLPPGRFGGRGLTWLGLQRHEWGDIHLWLGIALLALIVAHLVQHWKWVKASWQRHVGTLRSPKTWAVLAVLALLALLPLLVPTSMAAPGTGRGAGYGWARGASERAAPGWEDTAGRFGGGRGRHGRWSGRGAGMRRHQRLSAEPCEHRGWGSMELWGGDYGP